MHKAAALLVIPLMAGWPIWASAEGLNDSAMSGSPGQDSAQTGVTAYAPIVVGDHDGFGRLVFQWERKVLFETSQQGDRLTIRFPKGIPTLLQPVRKPVRNASRISLLHNGVEVELLPGVRTRSSRDGNRIVIDLLDPAPRSRAQPAPAAAIAPERSTAPAGETLAPVAGGPTAEATAQVPAITPRLGAAASPVDPAPAAMPGPSTAALRRATLPFDRNVGAALLGRGNSLLLAFDQRSPENLASVLARLELASYRLLDSADATLLVLTTKPGTSLQIRPDQHGWTLRVTGGTEAASDHPARIEAETGKTDQVALRVARPGQVLTVTDPETGLPLLLGTSRRSGHGVAETRHLPLFDLLATQLGVAVLARSDDVRLRRETGRFIVTATMSGAASAGAPTNTDREAAAGLTRSFAIPTGPVTALEQRLASQRMMLSHGPASERREARIACAETLLSLGRGEEVRALLISATAEEMIAGADPKLAELRGAAALIVGDLANSAGLAEGPDSEEIAVWRTLRAAALSDLREPDRLSSLPQMLLLYPEPLHAKLLPIAVDALAGHESFALLRRFLASALPEADKDLIRNRLADRGAARFARDQDWHAATKMLTELADLAVPPGPAPLPDAQRRMLTRLAAYAALGGEEDHLRWMRDRYAARMQAGPFSEAFATLTTDPLRALASLPRLQQEIGLIELPPSSRSSTGTRTESADTN